MASASENRKCPEDNICFGAVDQAFCKKISGKDENWDATNKICHIPRTEYQFAKYVGAWVSTYLLKIGLAVGLIMIIAAGILYMLSGTDPGKANLAKDLIFTSIVGLIAIFLAQVVLNLIIEVK